ncbi:MAG: gliding motility-associated C-terminal domain-containing protein [bacterium]|nr:gliding motility-associated C-terminal domain-containing protein [bacterium]
MSRLHLILVIASLPHLAYSQNFFNFDLEGEVTAISDLPYGWEAVDVSDPICLATNIGNATPDLSDMEGLTNPISCIGNPYSCQSFVSGLLSGPSSGGIYHEGIQQSVSGFEIDSSYSICFYQTNVKQSSQANDTSGCWAVYVDDLLIGVTAPSVNHLAPYSLILDWEFRQVTFTATSTEHLIKFIPYDDDLDISAPNNGIRMGIDYIYINEPPVYDLEEELIMPNVFTPNDDGVNDIFAPLQIGAIKSMNTLIINRWGNIVYDSNDIFIQWDGNTISGENYEEGTYFWMVSGKYIDNRPFQANGYFELLR